MIFRTWAGFLLGLCLISMGAGRPQQIEGVTLPHFNYDIPFTGEVLPALPGVERDLAGVEIQKLVDECRRVVAESASIIERRRSVDRTMVESYEITREALELPWIVCMVVVRRMGDSGEERWTETLEELFASWDRSVPVAWQSFSRASNLHLFLNEETIASYIRLTGLDELPAADLVHSYREIREEGRSRSVRAQAHGRLFAPYHRGEREWPEELVALFNDPSPAVRIGISMATPTPAIPREARDLAVGQLADPDPEVRRLAGMKYQAGGPQIGQEMVPALLRFLARDDIDEEARQAAELALGRRGYVPATNEDGLIAVPVKPGLQQRHMNGDLND